MKTEQKDIALGRIRGYLEAFSLFNTKTNHSYSFEFDVLDKLESVEQSLHEHLTEVAGVHSNSLQLNPITEEKAELQAALVRWLFSFLPETDTHYYLVDARQSFTLWHEEWRQQSVVELVELILKVAQPTTAYKVDFHPVRWYEAAWEDLALVSQQQVFLLHLGVSD